MKPVRRIFLILGAMSMFSLFQFDAMAKCSGDAGKFCKGGVNYDCRSGCYCTGSTNGVGTTNVDMACKNKDPDKEATLKNAGVYYCPKEFPSSAAGDKDITDCYDSKRSIASGGEYTYIHYGADEVIFKIANTDINWTKVYNDAGDVVTLPEEYSEYIFTDWSCNNGIGVKKPGDTFFRPAKQVTCTGFGRILCSKGEYFEDNGCKVCPIGNYCPGDNTKHLCEGNTIASTTGQSSCAKCPVGRSADDNHVQCIARSVNSITDDIRTNIAANILGIDGDVTYTVTYSCGDGATGAAPANGTATYNRLFTPASGARCIKSGFVFDGWSVSGTDDVKQAGVAFTWQYGQNKTFTAQWRDSGVRVYTLSFNAGTPGGDDARGVNVTGSMNSVEYQERASVFLPASGFSASGYRFEYWDCGNVGQYRVGGSFRMPGHNVTCTAQWGCESGKYLNGNNQCVSCLAGHYCPGDDGIYSCNGQQEYAQTGASSCFQCTNGTVDDNHTTCTPDNPNNSIECALGTYYPGSGNVCNICDAGYACAGGNFVKNNEQIQGRESCMPDKVSNSNRSACAVCPSGSVHNDDYTGCVNVNGDIVDPIVIQEGSTCLTPGKYLNNDGDCVSCGSSGYFCPGNNNRYRCPFNGTSINNGTSCKFNVSKASLYECWDEATSPSNYRGCMYSGLPPLETLR